MRRIAILAVCLGLLAAPAMAQTKAAIQKLENEWASAANTGNTAAMMATYTKDADSLPAGAKMMKGQKAIEAYWKEAVKDMQDVQCTTADVKPLGGSAAREIGTFAFKTKGQSPQEVTGKYAVVWRKIAGRWKLATDIWNMNK